MMKSKAEHSVGSRTAVAVAHCRPYCVVCIVELTFREIENECDISWLPCSRTMLSHNTSGNHEDNYHTVASTGTVLPLHTTKSLLLTIMRICFT